MYNLHFKAKQTQKSCQEARMTDQITPSQFDEAEGVEDWRLTSEGATAFFRARTFAESAQFVQAISDLQGVEDHRPGVDVRHAGVTVHMITITDDYFGISRRDVELARHISAAARKLGLTADPSAVQSLLIVPGATDITQVIPFWRAVLGYEPRRDSPAEDLVDPHDRGPAFWFEQMNEPRGDGGGAIHIAVWVPFEQAEARVAAALAAGGRMVRDEFAPAWWTLADAAGNEADIATTKSRG
jgi:4a-hydroxytetrahydrobiopterin dehydratase